MLYNYMFRDIPDYIDLLHCRIKGEIIDIESNEPELRSNYHEIICNYKNDVELLTVGWEDWKTVREMWEENESKEIVIPDFITKEEFEELVKKWRTRKLKRKITPEWVNDMTLKVANCWDMLEIITGSQSNWRQIYPQRPFHSNDSPPLKKPVVSVGYEALDYNIQCSLSSKLMMIVKNESICMLKNFSSDCKINFGVDLSQLRHPKTKESLLHLITRTDRFKVELLDYALNDCGLIAYINDKDVTGQTALHRAVAHNQFGMARILMSYGADDTLQDNNGKTAGEYKSSENYIVNVQDILPIEHYELWNSFKSVVLEYYYHRYPTELKTHIQSILAFMLVSSLKKVAPPVVETLHRLNISSTPLGNDHGSYHRFYKQELIQKAIILNKEKKYLCNDVICIPIDSPLYSEVLARNYPAPFPYAPIETMEQMWRVFNRVNAVVEKNRVPVMIDITACLKDEKSFDILKAELLRRGGHLSAYIIPYAIDRYKGVNTLLIPQMGGCFDRSRGKNSLEYNIRSTLTYNGFVLTPDQVSEARLDDQSLLQILSDNKISMTDIGMQGLSIPTVCRDFNDFLCQPVIQKFRALSTENNAPPYLKVIPESIYRLLDGFSDCSIDECFNKLGLNEPLQLIYFSLLSEINSLIDCKHDFFNFTNQVEFIHQQIQNLHFVLLMAKSDGTSYAYDSKELEKGVVTRLTKGPQPTISTELPSPVVHLKASASRAISSILSSVEAEKGSNNLTVVVNDRMYFELYSIIKTSATYSVHTCEGNVSSDETALPLNFDNPPTNPVDLFVCEFRHNISSSPGIYKPESILEQIFMLDKDGLLASKCTVAIDTTIALEQSDEIREFFLHPKIQAMIHSGALNVVLFRSAQKFDMYGMDNYYGGLTITVNEKNSFKSFNSRMNHPDDQLGGLSYQGITHLQKSSGDCIDKYRQQIMDNTQKLYRQLPQELIKKSNEKDYPVQIVPIQDEHTVFIHVIFEKYQAISNLLNHLVYFAEREGLPLTYRQSFGFMTTNAMRSDGRGLRISVGLESEAMIALYAKFFHLLKDYLDFSKCTDPELFRFHQFLEA